MRDEFRFWAGGLFKSAFVALLVLMSAQSPSLAGSNKQEASLRQDAGTAQQAGDDAMASTDPNSDYKLGSGDKVRISVFNQRDLTDVYQVDGLGRIAFPLVGQIQVGGLTPKQVEVKVARVLSPDYVKNPHVSVVVLNMRPFYIIGEVTKPGSYPYVSGMTMINAIALAGGFTYRADEDSFELRRSDKGGKKVKVDAKPETPVQPGDVITVNERIF